MNRVEVRLPRWPSDSFGLKVSGAVDFNGTLKELPLSVSKATSTQDKMAVINPGTIISRVYSTGDNVVATLAESGCFDQMTSEYLHGVRLPCDSLELKSPGVPDLAEQDFGYVEDDAEENEIWATLKFLGTYVRLYANVSYSSHSMELSGCDGDFRVLETREGWLRVRRWWQAGQAIITGWAPGYLFDTERLEGKAAPIGYGICEVPESDLNPQFPPVEQVHEVVVSRSARARAGARVFGVGGPWGKFAEETLISVSAKEGKLVRVLEIPGLSGSELQAWIGRNDLIAAN